MADAPEEQLAPAARLLARLSAEWNEPTFASLWSSGAFEPFGQRSKENPSRLVFDKEVAIDWHKYDRYQRIVGKVMVADPNCAAATCPKTLDAGMAQITVGLAWWYRKYANEQSAEDVKRYEFAEQEARAKRVGLWSDPNPTAPWDWRKEKRHG